MAYLTASTSWSKAKTRVCARDLIVGGSSGSDSVTEAVSGATASAGEGEAQRSALVSVVIPTRNSARTLEACLRSLQAQTHSPIELIVVDNHSGDDTIGIANRLADRVDVYGPERTAQRNRGARIATGEYLLFVDSDMRLEPDVVLGCLVAIGRSDSPAVIIPEISFGEGYWAQCRALERSCYVGEDSIEAARFLTRSAFFAAGGYDEELVAGEDWDLSTRVAAGRRLPRARSRISHDEGRLRFSHQLAKKWYYGKSLHLYLRKHPRAWGRANIVFRPVYFRNWRRLVRHPLLTLGMFALKSCEFAVVSAGMLAGLRRQRSQSTG
jgi:glycosyltransferase involved in cell wall biosynthesis